MARTVRAQVMIEEAAADKMLAGLACITSCNPVSEVITPTTPANSENITKNPVARLPIGKYIGNIRAGA